MKTTRPTHTHLLIAGAIIGFVSLQFFQPDLANSPQPPIRIAPTPVGAILKRACFDCHSNQTELRWFDKIAPASWLIASHVKQGRKALNFSTWNQLAASEQKAKLYLSLNDILAAEMPLPSYLMLHPQAKVTVEDIALLKQYLLTLSPRQQTPRAGLGLSVAHQDPAGSLGRPIHQIKPAPNGILYRSDYGNWKAISTTDRFDNGSMRVIYGNAVAVKAIARKQINPWPDGTVFAKVAWKANQDSTGLIRPGDFIQVEFMIKDRRQYADTQGWGWARWKGPDLKPYGQTRLFTHECISCHRPMKDNAFVFTLPLHLSNK